MTQHPSKISEAAVKSPCFSQEAIRQHMRAAGFGDPSPDEPENRPRLMAWALAQGYSWDEDHQLPEPKCGGCGTPINVWDGEDACPDCDDCQDCCEENHGDEPHGSGVDLSWTSQVSWRGRLTAGRSRFGGPLAVVEGRMGDRIADIAADPGQDPLPRAHAIAALPEVLEALKEALAWCKVDAANEDGFPSQEMLEARVDVLRAALAKVGGA